MKKIKKEVYIATLSLLLSAALAAIVFFTGITSFLNYKIYDAFMSVEYNLRHKQPTDDMVLVAIDNKTLSTMPERWPYPRAKFADAIYNLKKAGAKIIAIDFIFYGISTPEDDSALKKAIIDAGNVVLGAVMDENGQVHMSSKALGEPECGLVTKFQCSDGVVRKSLTYVLDGKDRSGGMVTWGIKVLKLHKGLDLERLTDEGSVVRLFGRSGEEWVIPVEPDTKSYLIHFRAHTSDFKIISFCDAVEDKFDPSQVNGKIVLIGMASTVLGDIQNTPIGWVPGITLNTNALLALCKRDFIKTLPVYIVIFIVSLGVISTSLVLSIAGMKKAMIIALAEAAVFFMVSFILLTKGFTWDYILFPLSVTICPFLALKLRCKIQTKKYWT